MAEEHPYLLTTVAAAHAVLIHKHLLSKSAAAVAAAIPHASLPFVLLNLRMGVHAPQKTCFMTVTKVRFYLSCWSWLASTPLLLHSAKISFILFLSCGCEQRVVIFVFDCLHVFPLVCAVSQTSSINVRKTQQIACNSFYEGYSMRC